MFEGNNFRRVIPGIKRNSNCGCDVKLESADITYFLNQHLRLRITIQTKQFMIKNFV